MEPEGSLLRSQELATCPYPEQDRSSPCPHPISLRYVLILYSHLCLGFVSDLLPSVLPTLFAPIRATCLAHQDKSKFEAMYPFRNMVKFLRRVVGTSRNPGGPPFVGCPRLLIQYIFAATLHIWRTQTG